MQNAAGMEKTRRTFAPGPLSDGVLVTHYRESSPTGGTIWAFLFSSEGKHEPASRGRENGSRQLGKTLRGWKWGSGRFAGHGG